MCTLCGKGPVQRLMSSPAIQFKGTGWYITDYAQKGKAGSESSSDVDRQVRRRSPSSSDIDDAAKSGHAPRQRREAAQSSDSESSTRSARRSR